MNIHKHVWLVVGLLAFLLVAVSSAHAQGDLPQDLIKKVYFEQQLDNQIPHNLTFTDSTGKQVQIGDYFDNGKPIILTLGYYECPVLCSLVRDGAFESIQEMEFSVGTEYELLVVSIDERETPKQAEMVRRASILEYDRSPSDEGWNFLVGEKESITALAEAIGFNYVYDESIDQYVHPSGIVILTPDGRISKYFYGIEFNPLDLRLSVVEASESEIGTLVDELILTCYHYDPLRGEYTVSIMNIIRILGALTVVVMGISIWMMSRQHDGGQGATPASP